MYLSSCTPQIPTKMTLQWRDFFPQRISWTSREDIIRQEVAIYFERRCKMDGWLVTGFHKAKKTET